MHVSRLLFVTLVCTGCLLQAPHARAAVVSNITSDGTLGTSISRVGNVYGIDGGTIKGGNLFQSFGAFTVGTGDVASFNGPNGIANILGRVTGGQQSQIDGTLRSTIQGANLFLLNPSGILFGPNASLDVKGSFHASTADYLRFADGAKFFANLAQNSVLTAANPVAFGFLGPTPAPITVQGSLLQVPSDQTLSLVGGNITIKNGVLQDGTMQPSSLSAANGPAQTGRLVIVGVGSAGEVQISNPDGTPTLNLAGFSSQGLVDLSDGPILDAGTVLLMGLPLGSHIMLDGSLNPGGPQALVGPDFVIDAANGQPRGQNLFFSFSRFDLYSGESATFTGTGSILNIIARITGGGQSFINGTILADTQGPNLFFFNPAGVIFGSQAMLDPATFLPVAFPGSFHVSTADNIGFRGDGGIVKVSAVPSPLPDSPDVLSTPPVSFGFTNPNPAPISILGSILQVPTGQTLSIIGGDIQIVGATLLAPGPMSRLQVASVGSAGDVLLSTPDGAPDLNVSSFSSLGRIDISQGSFLDASGDGGGALVIRGGRLFVDGSFVTVAALGDNPGAKVGIDIQVSGDMVLSNGTFVATAANGQARGGDVLIGAGSLGVDGGSLVTTITFGDGAAGDITITAPRVALTNGGGITSTSSLSPSGLPTIGDVGNITVTATEAMTISGAGSILLSETDTGGKGGQVAISTPSLAMDDGGAIASKTLGTGKGGDIALMQAKSLSLTGGAQISSLALGSGAGGTVTVSVAETAVMSGVGIDGTRSGILSGSFGGEGAGAAGDIVLVVGTPGTSGTLTLADGAFIQNGSPIAPQGGNVTVTATGSILIASGSGISSQTAGQDVGRIVITTPALTMNNGLINTSTLQTGRAGDILVNVGTMSMTNGAQIDSSSELLASGPGGNVTVTASGAVSISGQSASGPLNPFNPDPSSGLFSIAKSTGDAGQIVLSAPALTTTDGGKISVATSGAGRAGNITLNVGTLSLASGARVDSGTTGAGQGGTITAAATGLADLSGGAGLFSNAQADGAGGDINLQAAQVQLTNGGIISATSSGTGNAGNVNIAFQSTFLIENALVTTQALQADGGNILISSPPLGSLLHLVNSSITTSVGTGQGKGGNITIDPQFVVLDNSQIRADAFGGPGGNILIVADVFLTQGSILSASSALSTPGTIDIQAAITDISGSVARLPENALQAAALLRASCAVRLSEGKSSSLVVAGRGGVPPDPQGLLPSPLLAGDLPAGPQSSWGDIHPRKASPALARVMLDSTCAR